MNSALAMSQKHEQAVERLQNKTVTNFSEYIYICTYILIYALCNVFVPPLSTFTCLRSGFLGGRWEVNGFYISPKNCNPINKCSGFHSLGAACVFAAGLRPRAEQRGAAGLLCWLWATTHQPCCWCRRIGCSRVVALYFPPFSSLSGALNKCYDIFQPQAVFKKLICLQNLFCSA